MLLSNSKRVRKSTFSFSMTDAHNNAFGFAQNGYIYTYTGNSKTEGEAWLRMQRTGETGKNRRRYLLYFANEAEPSAVVDRHNNIYDMDGHYIATLSHSHTIVILLVLLGLVLFLSGLSLYLGGAVIMETTAPFSDENTVDLAIGNDGTTGNNGKPSDKVQEQEFDIFGLDDDDEEEVTTKATNATTKKTGTTDSTTRANSKATTNKNTSTTTKGTTAPTTTANVKGEAEFTTLEPNKLIYPGLEGEYPFMVKNSGEVPLYYKMNFTEQNTYNIPIRFRLKKSGNYVVGNNSTWVTIDKLNTDPQLIKKGEEIVYTLEWKWVEYDDAFDTQLGTEAVANYTFNVKVDFESAQ